MKLTATNVRTLTAPPGRTEAVFFDDDVKGFGVRVKPSGARSYVMCWKVGGKHRRVTIGAISEIDFGKAKKQAGDYKAAIRLGKDPANEIGTAKLDAMQTFKSVVALFLEASRERYRPLSFKEVERHLTKHAKLLNKKPTILISQQDIAVILEKTAKNSGDVTANRVRASLSVFFVWCLSHGHAKHNPTINTKKKKEKSRDRVLTPPELRLIWNALGDDQYGAIVKLLLLTGQRESEIGDLSRDEINEALIILPPERTKNERAHVVPLSAPALQIIQQHEKERRDRQLIFGIGEGGFSGWSRCKERLDKRIAASNGGEAIPHWTLHDLRRTFATYAGGGLPPHMLGKLPPREKELAEGLEVLPHIVEAILNHIGEHKAGVAQVYNKSSYERQKRVALDLWADRVAAIIRGRASNVTTLRREA